MALARFEDLRISDDKSEFPIDKFMELPDILSRLSQLQFTQWMEEDDEDIVKGVSLSEIRELQREFDEFNERILQFAEDDGFELKELKETGGTAAEYHEVLDRVLKYRKKEHAWNPRITKIEKIINPKLKEQYKMAKKQIKGAGFPTMKFHGAGDEAIKQIARHGFNMPEKPGMFGRGIYFATDASKSAQGIYTKGSNKLLLCHVLLGNTLTVDTAQEHLSGEKLAEKGFHSVYAKRGTKATGGVHNDEYVVYNPAQTLPAYIIHYTTC